MNNKIDKLAEDFMDLISKLKIQGEWGKLEIADEKANFNKYRTNFASNNKTHDFIIIAGTAGQTMSGRVSFIQMFEVNANEQYSNLICSVRGLNIFEDEDMKHDITYRVEQKLNEYKKGA
jgi:hypothetical protein